jgi:hypothetical protein
MTSNRSDMYVLQETGNSSVLRQVMAVGVRKRQT